jgi:hypothetical protein
LKAEVLFLTEEIQFFFALETCRNSTPRLLIGRNERKKLGARACRQKQQNSSVPDWAKFRRLGDIFGAGRIFFWKISPKIHPNKI